MRKRSAILTVVALVTTLFVSACSLLDTFRAGLQSTPTPPSAVEAATEIPAGSPAEEGGDPAAVPSPTASPPRDLVVWLVVDTTGIELIETQIGEYADLQLEATAGVVVERKTATGPGSMQSYLEIGRNIAPTIMPDLVLIPFSLLPNFVNSGFVYPLTPYIAEADFEDLYPAGRTISRVGEQFFGYPHGFSDLRHLAYDQETITQTIPSTWDGFVNLPAQFVFAGIGTDGADLLLQLYLAEGGTLRDETGKIRLEEEPLRLALERIQAAKTGGLVFSNSSQIATQSGSWDSFLDGSANLVWTNSELYRLQNGQNEDIRFAPLPGPQGPIPARVKGWVWAISTADPQRQQLAADLLSFLILPEQMGSWSNQTLSLPTRRSAFSGWPSSAYTDFLQEQLDEAAVYPTAALGPVTDALSAAIRTLLLSANPETAIPDIARTAITAIP